MNNLHDLRAEIESLRMKILFENTTIDEDDVQALQHYFLCLSHMETASIHMRLASHYEFEWGKNKSPITTESAEDRPDRPNGEE